MRRADRPARPSGAHRYRAGHEYEPKAERPTPGSADLCFVVDSPIEEVVAELGRAGIPIEQGPVERTGAEGTMISYYLRDPDANLIELSNYSDRTLPSIETTTVPDPAGTGASIAISAAPASASVITEPISRSGRSRPSATMANIAG